MRPSDDVNLAGVPGLTHGLASLLVPHIERIAGILLNKKIEVDLETKQMEVEFSLPS